MSENRSRFGNVWLVFVLTAILFVVAYLASPSFQDWAHHPVLMYKCRIVERLPSSFCQFGAMWADLTTPGRGPESKPIQTEGASDTNLPIDALIVAKRIPKSDEGRTVIEITNRSPKPYYKLEIDVEGYNTNRIAEAKIKSKWSVAIFRLRENDTLELFPHHLSNEAGASPIATYIPLTVEIRCNRGVYRAKVQLQ